MSAPELERRLDLAADALDLACDFLFQARCAAHDGLAEFAAAQAALCAAGLHEALDALAAPDVVVAARQSELPPRRTEREEEYNA